MCSDKNEYFWQKSPARVGGVTVSIVAFQAIDPGSTPGQRIFLFLYSLYYTLFFLHKHFPYSLYSILLPQTFS